MNLGEIIGLNASEFIVFELKRKKPILLVGHDLERGDFLVIQKEDIPYIKNMLLKEEYQLYKFRKGTHEHHQANRITAIKFCNLSRAIRDGICQKAPRTGAETIFIVSKYD